MTAPCRCDNSNSPGCLGVVLIVLVVLWLTGNCNGPPKAPPPAQQELSK